ncbi:MAG: CDP-alcohol phosphatidyltransferase, partial [uncultured Acetobacteraceae bacterium]
ARLGAARPGLGPRRRGGRGALGRHRRARRPPAPAAARRPRLRRRPRRRPGAVAGRAAPPPRGRVAGGRAPASSESAEPSGRGAGSGTRRRRSRLRGVAPGGSGGFVRKLQQGAPQARLRLPDALGAGHPPRRGVADVRRLLQGRHRLRHQARVAAPRLPRGARLRRARRHAQHGDGGQLGAGVRGAVVVLARRLAAGARRRLDHDLPRHGGRQAGAGDADLHQVRQRLRPRHRPDPPALLVARLDRGAGRGRDAAGAPHGRGRGDLRRLRPATAAGGPVPVPARHAHPRLAALRQRLPAGDRAAQPEPGAADRGDPDRPPGPRHPRGGRLDRLRLRRAGGGDDPSHPRAPPGRPAALLAGGM